MPKGSKKIAAGDEAVEDIKIISRRSHLTLVKKAIRAVEEKLDSADLKPTVADLLRLLEFEKSNRIQRTREVKATWVDPEEVEPRSAK